MSKFYGTIVAILAALAMSAPLVSSVAQVIETTENKPPRAAVGVNGDEQLGRLCELAVMEYETVRKRIDERIEFLEGVDVIGDLKRLKEDLGARPSIPQECVVEIGRAVDGMIEQRLEEKMGDVDLSRIETAQRELEQMLMPDYRDLGQAFEQVCSFCDRKPARLQDDPLFCTQRVDATGEPSRKLDRVSCDEAMIRYRNARDALLYRRDLCRQSAKIEGMDGVLFWFQGREDLPLACAVEIKAFMDEARARAEGRTSASRYAFAVAHEKCGRALFPIYVRYAQAAEGVCRSCRDAGAELAKDGMSCH